MASEDINTLIRQLEQSISGNNYKNSTSLLSRAKIALLRNNALIPSPSTPPAAFQAARTVLELGALISIRQQDPEAFTRYFQQLQPFYDLSQPGSQGQRSKITGLYLLLLLSQGDYAGFHTLLESLEVASGQTQTDGKAKSLEDNPFIQYPILLEQWLMEGSYDRVWEETKSERVPSEEFVVFSDILIGTIRSEVASCSEKAYSSIPVMNAKSLLFLDSEGSVVGFSQQRGWHTADSRVYFPAPDAGAAEHDVLAASGQVIENTLGYARELETIV